VFKIIRVPTILNSFFGSLTSRFHWDHFEYFRWYVLAVGVTWGRRNVSNLCRQLRASTHRTRFNNFVQVGRWDAAACLRHKAEELLAQAGPAKGDTVYLIVDDSKLQKRGKTMEAVGYLHDPTTGRRVLAHQCVTAVIRYHGVVIPLGVRLYVKCEHAPALGLPFRKTTQLAADLIREFEPPAGVKVVVLFDSYYLCPVVVSACREKGFHYASTLKNNRNLFRDGRKMKAGRYGRNVYRRNRKRRLPGSGRRAAYYYVDAGWLDIGGLGPHHVVFSRKGRDPLLGIVTDHPKLSAAAILHTYAERWSIEVFFKDTKQLLGLGQYQNGTYRAAVTHLHLVCFAYALLTHLRLTGAQGKPKSTRAATASTSEVQSQLRRLVWSDLVAHLEEQPSGTSFVKELELLLVA